ncbi:MAG: polyisoprenoid-binding protein YceI [Crocinitomix sp.]|jgi:polyisoprenoid-binding protein YceI
MKHSFLRNIYICMSKQINVNKMKKVIILGLFAMPFFFASCGGGEAEGDTTDSDSTATVEEVIPTTHQSYSIDTASTVINWMNYDGEEVSHQGAVKALEGNFEVATTGDELAVSAGYILVDLNSITESEGSDKLIGHLMAPDFFDVNQFATTEFVFNSFEDGMMSGSLTVLGKEVEVSAPVSISADENGATLELGEFAVDFAAFEMPFFVREKEEAPEGEWHNSSIGFTATVNGVKL